VPNSGKLTVVVLEAKNLKKMDVGGLSGIWKTFSLIMRESGWSSRLCGGFPSHLPRFDPRPG